MSEKFADVQNTEFLDAVEKTFVSYKEGKRVKGTVISADDKGIKLSIGGKKDGFIPKEDVNIDGSYEPSDYPEGTELEVRIGKSDADTGCILLSKKAIDEIKEADKIVETIRNGERLPSTKTSKRVLPRNSAHTTCLFPRLRSKKDLCAILKNT